jgi:hypothetical protein
MLFEPGIRVWWFIQVPETPFAPESHHYAYKFRIRVWWSGQKFDGICGPAG